MVSLPLRPKRGGFLRPFGTGIFIRDYLSGLGPRYGVEAVSPETGAPITDIHKAYKRAIHMAMAEDMVAQDMERAIRTGQPLSEEEIEERRRFYLERIPSKLTRMRYHSFARYFHFLKQLGLVERSGKVEGSIVGGPEDVPPPRKTGRGTVLVEVPQPRIFYRLTDKGRAAGPDLLSDPLQAVYRYSREQRSPKRRKYFSAPRTRRKARA
jgi:hypothetical protein